MKPKKIITKAWSDICHFSGDIDTKIEAVATLLQ